MSGDDFAAMLTFPAMFPFRRHFSGGGFMREEVGAGVCVFMREKVGF